MLEFAMNSHMRNLISDQTLARSIGSEEGSKGLLVRPYTNDICAHWRFVDETTARNSSATIYKMFLGFKTKRDFIGYGHGEKFLEMGFTRSFVGMLIIPVDGSTMKFLVTPDPKRKIGRTNEKSKAAAVFKEVRDLAAYDETYQQMRREWNLMKVPTQPELTHLQLQAMLRDHDIPESEIKYIGDREYTTEYQHIQNTMDRHAMVSKWW